MIYLLKEKSKKSEKRKPSFFLFLFSLKAPERGVYGSY